MLVKQLVAPNVKAGKQFKNWGLLLAPTEDKKPGKTGMWDEALQYDTEPWLDPFFRQLVEGRSPNDPLWTQSPAEFLDDFHLAIECLGLDFLQPTRYSFRHGGASEDLLSGFRDLASVKKRGTWRSDSSLNRYGKDTRLQMEVNKIPAPLLAYGALVQSNLEKFFISPSVVPPPPRCAPLDPGAAVHGRRQRRRVT